MHMSSFQRPKSIAIIALVCLGLLTIGYLLFMKTMASYPWHSADQRLCIERVHTKATQFRADHTIPREAYVTNQRISSALRYRLVHKETGVFVLYAPPGFGKSIIATHVLQDLLQQGFIEGVIRLDSFDLRFEPNSVLNWLSSSVDCAHANNVGLTGLFASQERKTVILIDQFEALFRMTTTNNIHAMMHNVAMESVHSTNFVVLLLTHTEESCRTSLSWNGGHKFRPVFRGMEDPCHPSLSWTQDELMTVVRRHLEELKSYAISETHRSQLEALIQHGNISQVGEVYNFLVDHCDPNYRWEVARNFDSGHQQSLGEMKSPNMLVIVFVVVMILFGFFAYIY